MISTLLHMSGIPTRQEIKDLLLRWVVIADNGDCDAERVGNALIQAYSALAYDDDDELEDTIAGQELRDLLFKQFAAAYRARVIRFLQSEGLEHDHVTTDWVRDREIFGWFETFDMDRVDMPVELAKSVGEALGDDAGRAAVSAARYHERMAKERASA